jgi:hypothetical protein
MATACPTTSAQEFADLPKGHNQPDPALQGYPALQLQKLQFRIQLVSDLYALTHYLTYKIGGGSPTMKSGNISLSGRSRVDWEIIVYGDHASAVPTFTINSFTGKRGGGSSRFDLEWP